MSTYLKTYCTIDDIQLVAPFVFDYDRKRRVTSWVSHSGSGSSEVFVAGSVGKFDQLFENDIEQTSVSSVGDVNADGKFNCTVEEIDACPVQIQGPKSKALKAPAS